MKQSIHFWLPSAIAICSLVASSPAIAQVVPDATLPNNSSVASEGKTNTINGGTRTGNNLFHSFEQFSIPAGGEAYFNNAVDVQNIISRVTSGYASNIDGLIRANGTANLFLINPNGIVFGANASLNIGGSFLVSTANAIGFGAQGFFSATNPNNPELLTVNPSALLFNQIRAASIENSSVAPSSLSPSSEATTGLHVSDGNSLLLVGGDINMDGGGLFALGGRVELGGLASAGTVGLNGDNNNLSLSFPDSVDRSNIFLSNGAAVDVAAGNGGSIAVNARNLVMTGESRLSVGIGRGLGFNNSQAGNIEVNVDGEIYLDYRSSIDNQVLEEATANGGNLTIKTSKLSISNGAKVTVSNLGEYSAGNLGITASLVLLDNGYITAQTRSGNGGNLKLNIANLLLLRRGSQISTTAGTAQQGGNGGNITIATDVVVLDPSENSYIVANGFEPTPGSNIQVNAIGIFGTKFQEQLTPESGIVASGKVALNTLFHTISSGIVSLPVVPVDTQVTNTCSPGSSQAQSEFVVTGRGGLPPNPGDALSTDAVQVDWVTLNPEVENRSSSAIFANPTSSTLDPIVEAQGWVISKNGKVVLTATAPNVTPYSSWYSATGCHTFQTGS